MGGRVLLLLLVLALGACAAGDARTGPLGRTSDTDSDTHTRASGRLLLHVDVHAGPPRDRDADADAQTQSGRDTHTHASRYAGAHKNPSGTGDADGRAERAPDDPIRQAAGAGAGDYRADPAGGPFPYRQDGAVFQNRERLLPARPNGYYHEYTVKTPGSPDRGAWRIIVGEKGELYYTDDHYDSFRQVVMP